MFKSTMRFLVVLFMLCFACTVSCHVFLQVCLRKKDAGAVWAFEVAVVTGLLLSHSSALVYVYEDFFAV